MAHRRSLLRFRFGALTLLTLATLAVARPSLAAPRTPDDAAVEEAAKSRYTEGIRLYKKRKYEEARAAFLQASALKPHSLTTLMLAESALKTGRWIEAVRQFDAYTADVSDPPPKIADLVESGRREARSHLARLRFDVPSGAAVSIDGERATSLDGPVDVMPGVHTITVTHEGQTKTQTIEVGAGRTVDIHPSFAPKPLVPPEDTRTRPTPAPAPPPDDQPHTEASESSSILAPPATTWPVYAAGAIGLGGLAAAVIFGGLQANASHAVDVATQTLTRNGKSPTNCDSASGWATASGQNNDEERGKYAEACSTLQRNQNLSQTTSSAFGVSLIVGLSGTALAAGWFFFAPKSHGEATSPAEGRPRVLPWVGTNGAGASVTGRF
jgi:hypothetical protein